MASYPSIRQDPSTVISPLPNKRLDVSDGGTVRGTALHSVTVVDIGLAHVDVSDADKASIEAFYTTNKNIALTFNYDGDSSTYSVVFVAEPTYTWAFPGYWNIDVSFMGTKN